MKKKIMLFYIIRKKFNYFKYYFIYLYIYKKIFK